MSDKPTLGCKSAVLYCSPGILVEGEFTDIVESNDIGFRGMSEA